MELACERFRTLDGLGNNAGIGPISLPDEDWEEMIDVNLKGFLSGAAVSATGLKVVPLQAVHAGTKNAVRTISEGLRQNASDLRRDGRVRVANRLVGCSFEGFVGGDLRRSARGER